MLNNPGDILRRGLIECPHCAVQREARLARELLHGELVLALARCIKGRLIDEHATFKRLAGVSLDDYVASRRKPANGAT